MFHNGDIILTRNANRPGANLTPGYWNHSAIITNYRKRLCAVEVHYKNDVVTAVPLQDFIDRYAEWKIFRLKHELEADYHPYRIADITRESIGTKINYAITRIRTQGREIGTDNCTSFVRKCYAQGCDYDFDWVIPDDITRDEMMTLVK